MTRFIQLHMLTSYPPANLNRDDLGQPKTAWVGGKQRIRVSSQSLKRAWRTSERFQEAMSGTIGTRTKRLGVEVHERLVAGGIEEKKAVEWAKAIAGVFGELKKDSVEIEQLVHVAPEERAAIDALVDRLIAEKRKPTDEELGTLLQDQAAVDIAMFGRMLAGSPEHNVDAAVQVAHAISVHEAVVEDDYFTAVDDLKGRKEDAGAGHVGEAAFAAAVFYQYVCIDRDLLKRNLDGNEELTARAIRALGDVAHRVPPKGKQNSFASRSFAFFSRAEKGLEQPRSLALAFLRPVAGEDYGNEAGERVAGGDYGNEARERMVDLVQKFDRAYGPCAEASYTMDVLGNEGTLAELLEFIASDAP